MESQARPIVIAVMAAMVAIVFAMSCGDKSKHAGCKGDKDCKNGQVVNTLGALTFRFGDFFRGRTRSGCG